MNAHERDLLARLEAMPLEHARTAIHTKALGSDFGSPNHDFCVSWLADKEAAARDARENAMLAASLAAAAAASDSNRIAAEANRIASRAQRWAMYAAIIAAVALAISAKSQIKSLITWLLT